MLFGRRFRFAVLIMASQLLLIALAVVMLVQLILIATHGRVEFVEGNPAVLATEIVLAVVISLFGITVFAIQARRLGEKRSSDTRGGPRGNPEATRAEAGTRRPDLEPPS